MISLKENLENCDIEELAKDITNMKKMSFSEKHFEGQKIEQKKLKSLSSREWKFLPASFFDLMQKDFVKIEQLDFVIAGGENGSKPVEYFWVPNKYWEFDEDSAEVLTVKRTLEVNHLVKDLIQKEFPKLAEEKQNKKLTDMLAKLPEKISIPKKYLVKSLVRRIQDLQDQTPYLAKDFPHLYFLDYRELSKKVTEEYFKWGEIFRRTVPNWVHAPPRLASIFLLYRVGLLSNKMIAIRTPEAVESSRMVGCIFIPKNEKMKTRLNMDVLYAYLASSIFLFDYIKKSRVAAGAFRRLNSTDLRSLMKFPKINDLQEDQKKKICDASNALNRTVPIKNMANFVKSISKARRNDPDSVLRKLDEIWCEILEIPIGALETLYDEILNDLNRYIK